MLVNIVASSKTDVHKGLERFPGARVVVTRKPHHFPNDTCVKKLSAIPEGCECVVIDSTIQIKPKKLQSLDYSVVIRVTRYPIKDVDETYYVTYHKGDCTGPGTHTVVTQNPTAAREHIEAICEASELDDAKRAAIRGLITTLGDLSLDNLTVARDQVDKVIETVGNRGLFFRIKRGLSRHADIDEMNVECDGLYDSLREAIRSASVTRDDCGEYDDELHHLSDVIDHARELKVVVERMDEVIPCAKWVDRLEEMIDTSDGLMITNYVDIIPDDYVGSLSIVDYHVKH